MSKAYEESMLTLSLNGAVLVILKRTFGKGEDFESEELFNFADQAYILNREIMKAWPHQDSERAVERIQEKTNKVIRGNKHLQGKGTYAVDLMTIITGRTATLSRFVKDPVRRPKLDKLLNYFSEMYDLIEENMPDEEFLDKRVEVGCSILDELNEGVEA